MLEYCFANLKHYLLTDGNMLDPPQGLNALGSFPNYVTYNKKDNLRGCQGTLLFGDLESTLPPLGDYLQTFSIHSAMTDHRFKPM